MQNEVGLKRVVSGPPPEADETHRSPTVDRLIGIACIEAELTEVGTQLHATLPDGRLAPAVVEVYPIYDPEKKRPRG